MKYSRLFCLILCLTATLGLAQQPTKTPAPMQPAPNKTTQMSELDYYKNMYALANKSADMIGWAIGASLGISALILAIQSIYTFGIYKRQLDTLKRDFNREIEGLQQSLNTLNGVVTAEQQRVVNISEELSITKMLHNARLLALEGTSNLYTMRLFLQVAEKTEAGSESYREAIYGVQNLLAKLTEIEDVDVLKIETQLQRVEQFTGLGSVTAQILNKLPVFRNTPTGPNSYRKEMIKNAS